MNDPAEPPKPPVALRWLPFRAFWPVLAGAAAGIALRLVFAGKPGQSYAPMMASFIMFSPLLVGMVTVYVAEKLKCRSWGYQFSASLVAALLYVIGTLLLVIEGWICAIVIIPLFALIGGLGGLLMGAILRISGRPRHTLYSFAVLPLILGQLESLVPLPNALGTVERVILIDAPPDKVWRQLMNASAITPDEIDRAWMYRIGVPLPLEGTTTPSPEGLVRSVRMGKSIHFEQVATHWDPGRYVHWTYRFQPDSFPAGALDDHVLIGGHYFDIENTIYSLTSVGASTELHVSMRYRVSTQFNWYAVPIGRLMIGNFETTVLDFYKRRSERAS